MAHSPKETRDAVLGNPALAGETFFDLVQRRAQQHGAKQALTFLGDGENETASLTYAELDAQARRIAGGLQSRGLTGQRVLLLYPSGLEFVTTFLGCLYAGVIAVPAYPPRLNRNVLRLMGMAHDAEATLAFTTPSLLERTRRLFDEAGMQSLRLMASDDLSGEAWHRPQLNRESLAFLQYTSGSTSEPKGVMVSHGNLLENHRMMQHSFGQNAQTKIVTWLPMFHDMGLIGNVLQALYLGVECVILPPETFLMKPVRWLAAITRHRATFSGAPNFAYELCAQKVTAAQRSALDLSSWESAYVGAEPVRHATLEAFAQTFAECGFRKEALYPCYGLAEASLFVSGPGKLKGAHSAWFGSAALEEQTVKPVAADEIGARPLVSCGLTWLDQRIAIVDPETGCQCASDKVGEIWVSGGNVAQGYWKRAEATEHTFKASLGDEPKRHWLRTGDLGFFHGDELFIASRLKDLIIVAGRNHDPADIEASVLSSHPALRAGACAAFQIGCDGEARLVVAAELERTFGTGGQIDVGDTDLTKPVQRAIREAVSLNHDLALQAIVLLRPAGLPKTSSGKIQRHACRAAYLNQTLPVWIPRK